MSCDRYLVLCSGKSEQRDAHVASLIRRTGLHNVWETDRYVALISEDMASIPFAGNDGLVIGELFHRNPDRPTGRGCRRHDRPYPGESSR